MGLTKPKATSLSHLVDSRVGNPNYDITNIVSPLDFNTWNLYVAGTGSGDTITTTASGANGRRLLDLLTLGKTYRITATATYTGGGDFNMYFGFSVRQTIVTGKTSGTHDIDVVLTASQTELYIRIDAAASGETLQFSTFEVQEWDGEELVPDPSVGFVVNDVSKWTAYGANTVEQDGNAVKIIAGSPVNSFGAYCYLRGATGSTFTSDFNVGDKLKIVIRAKITSGGSAELFPQDDGAAGIPHTTSITSTEYETFIVDHTVGGNSLYIKLSNLSDGETVWIEFVSLMKVTGLVAAYNMIPSPGGVLVDISGEGENADIDAGIVSTKDGMRFHGDGKYIYNTNSLNDFLSITKTWTVACRIKPRDIAALSAIFSTAVGSTDRASLAAQANWIALTLYDGAAHTISGDMPVMDEYYNVVAINIGTLLLLYINGVSQSGVNTGGTDGTAALALGAEQNRTNPYDGDLIEIMFFNYAFSEQESIDYHNSFQKLVKRGNLSDHPVGSTI